MIFNKEKMKTDVFRKGNLCFVGIIIVFLKETKYLSSQIFIIIIIRGHFGQKSAFLEEEGL